MKKLPGIKNEDVKKILVVTLQGIGDLLLVTPLLRVLRRNLTETEITVLTFDTNKELLLDNEDVDKIIYFDINRIQGLLSKIKLILSIRKEKFGLVICAFPSGLRSALVAFLGGAKIRIGQDLHLFKRLSFLFTDKVEINEVKHAAEMNLDFARVLGLDVVEQDKELKFPLSEKDISAAENFLQISDIEKGERLICLHPGGSKRTMEYRSWPIENFARLADILSKKIGIKILIIGGLGEEKIAEEIVNLTDTKPINCAGKFSLRETAALIKRCILFVGNNSGLMHIAAAMKTPVVAIFGPADPKIHAPWRVKHFAIIKNLDCFPCYYPFLRRTLPETRKTGFKGHIFRCNNKTYPYECIKTVTVEEVLKKIENILE